MHKLLLTSLCLIAVLAIKPAHATEHIQSYIPNAEKVGEGRLTYLFWEIYDATLYASEGAWQEGEPLALKLSYLRNLEGKKIADRSVEEMRKQGITNEVALATWHSQMRNIFPDVNEGISLTGILTQTGDTIFYKDNTEIGRIRDPLFSRSFFNIWLSEKTSAPDLRLKLLGAV